MQNQGVTDIDSLCLEVRDRESRRLISEAVAAYRGGALRSAIMSTWIAVAYDIISKARELASQGDAVATTFVTALDNAISNSNVANLQSIENALLQTAYDQFQFVTRHECDTLKRLYDDRHLCAHPAFVADDQLFQPSLELARAHIVHALHILLIQAPIQGKSAIDRFEFDFSSRSFPVLPESIDAYMRSKYLDRAKDALVINLIKRVLTLPFFSERAHVSGKERQLALVLGSIAASKTAIYDNFVPSFVGSGVDRVEDDVLLRLCTYLEVDTRIWTWLTESVRIRLKRLLETSAADDLKALSAFDAFAIPELAEVLQKRIDEFDQDTQISIIAESPRREFVERAIEIYGDSGSYLEAETRGRAIIVPEAPYFTTENIQQLLEKAANNGQIWYANGTPANLDTVFDETSNMIATTEPHWKTYLEKMSKYNRAGRYSGLQDRLNALGTHGENGS